MEITNFAPNYSNQTSFNARFKNSKVLKKVLESANDKELSRFNAILDVMPQRSDSKIYDFVEMFCNGTYKICMDDVIKNPGRGFLMSWHSSDIAEGRVVTEVYSKALEKANNILSRVYVSETKDAPREISLAEIYSKLAD